MTVRRHTETERGHVSTRYAPRRLRVWTRERDWRWCWLRTYWREDVWIPPEGATLMEASDMADKLRARGAGVRMEWK